MADYAVPAGDVGAHEKTMVALTVDTVTFEVGNEDAPNWGPLPKAIEVLTNGAADIYVTVDGRAPTVKGTQCYRVPAQAGATVIDVTDSNARDAVVVKLISSGTPIFSVSRAD